MNNTKIKYSLTATAVILGCLMAAPGMSQDFSVPQPLNLGPLYPSMVNIVATSVANCKRLVPPCARPCRRRAILRAQRRQRRRRARR